MQQHAECADTGATRRGCAGGHLPGARHGFGPHQRGRRCHIRASRKPEGPRHRVGRLHSRFGHHVSGRRDAGRVCRQGFVEPNRLVHLFGDSLTVGATILTNDPYAVVHPPETAYPTVLRQLLSARYSDQTITVFNRGLPGEQASRALPRFIATFVTDVPDVVVLQEGYNDVRGSATDVVGIANAIAGIRELAGEARRRGARVFICTLAPGRPGRIQIQTSALQYINDQLRLVARSEGAVLVDLFSALQPDVNANVSIDGLHLTPLGYRRVAETVFAAIRADLEIR